MNLNHPDALKRAPAAGARVAVVGAGIAGLATAWLLSSKYQVTLFESGAYFGGHSNTVDVTLEGKTHPVDTGFLVHNDLTYPNLIALFAHLGVKIHSSDMSFGVSIDSPDIEWAGTSLNTVFAQRRNLLRPGFLSMLRDILRFNRQALRYLEQVRREPLTLGQLLERERYGDSMRNWYLLPMAAAIWSTSARDILAFPAETFLAFCLNHRLLQIENRPKWKTVLGGSREYVRCLLQSIPDARLNCPVLAVRRNGAGVEVTTEQGTEFFEAAVLACHAPSSLAMLDATPQEHRVLASFRYQPNEAVLHTDIKLLPRCRRVWSAWNYLSATGEGDHRPVAVSYLLNQLQPLAFETPVIVTLNPHRQPDPAQVLARFAYEHPVLDQQAVVAQKTLSEIQGNHSVWFCGAWAGYGFHEDGLKSALRVVRDFGVTPPWAAVYD